MPQASKMGFTVIRSEFGLWRQAQDAGGLRPPAATDGGDPPSRRHSITSETTRGVWNSDPVIRLSAMAPRAKFSSRADLRGKKPDSSVISATSWLWRQSCKSPHASNLQLWVRSAVHAFYSAMVGRYAHRALSQ